MRMATRNMLDRCFSGVGVIAILVMAATLVVILSPILKRGVGAVVFRGTVEHRRLMAERFNQGNPDTVAADVAEARRARGPVYAMLERYKTETLAALSGREKRDARMALNEVENLLAMLLGPPPGAPQPVLPRQQYGQTRWDRALVKLDDLRHVQTWDYSNPDRMGAVVYKPRAEEFAGTALEPLFAYVHEHSEALLRPRWTVYTGFFYHKSIDSHIFGGIKPELLGTVYLAVGAMVVGLPLGIIAAIYFAEYARDGRIVGLLRTCVSTLAGVPSIVFGLFGLAFFINTMHVSHSKSVLAGALTLALLVLPTVIRAAEEAIRAVPHSYREAAVSLGAGRWRTVMSVILPAALPGILTGTVISLGRAAGETAPIIFTAAVSVGRALNPIQALSQPTPALSWNIYNLCTEHEAVDEIRHVQFGMVATLVLVVLLLNLAAIVMRARISKKLKG
jgi:phosphate transport system permease protein